VQTKCLASFLIFLLIFAQVDDALAGAMRLPLPALADDDDEDECLLVQREQATEVSLHHEDSLHSSLRPIADNLSSTRPQRVGHPGPHFLRPSGCTALYVFMSLQR
jgi:hypothetical protein